MGAVLACSLCGSGACARAHVDLCRTLNRWRSPGRGGTVSSTPGQTSTPTTQPTRAATQKGRARR